MTLPTKPFVCLAPMAGITDLPFRRVVQRFGADRVTSEMVASAEMVAANKDMRAKAELGAGLDDTAVQLAGREAHWMAEATRVVQDLGARFIDINMGCPAKRVTGGMSGSALMRDLDLATTLIDAVVSAAHVPVSLKMRLGWDDDQKNASDLAQRAEASGVTLITVHGRTRCQFYQGRADWAAIAPVKAAVAIPVIANGDIVDLASARTALAQSGADGIMIGRGAQGAPWRVAQLRAALTGQSAPNLPSGADLVQLIATHYDDMLSFYGRDLGARCARKHLGWYLDEASAPRDLRARLLTEANPDRVLAMLGELADPEVIAA